MRLRFYWDDRPFLSAICESDVVGADGVCPLACILTDDGGLGVALTLEWRITALSRVESALRGEADPIDWSTETFCSDIGRDVVKIYMDGCESFAQVVPTATFKRAIEASIEFFRMPASIESRLEIEV